MPAPQLDASILPTLDFVLISHNHYDHLDRGTVMALHKAYGSSLAWWGTCNTTVDMLQACNADISSQCVLAYGEVCAAAAGRMV